MTDASQEGTLPKDAVKAARDRVIEWGKQNPNLVQPIERSTLLLLLLIDEVMQADFEWFRSRGVPTSALEHARMEEITLVAGPASVHGYRIVPDTATKATDE